MAGAAETRVKHAWEGYSEAQTPPPPMPPPQPETHQASGDFTATGAESHTPPGRRLGNKTPFLPAPRVRSGWPGCRGMWGAAEKGSGVGGLAPTQTLPTSRVSTQLPCMGIPGLSGVSECVHSNSVSGSQGQAQGEEGILPRSPRSWVALRPQPWLFHQMLLPPFHFEGPQGTTLPHRNRVLLEDCRL